MVVRPFVVKRGKRYYMESLSHRKSVIERRAVVFRRLGYRAYVGRGVDFFALYVRRDSVVARLP